jgi:hypothetical protein
VSHRLQIKVSAEMRKDSQASAKNAFRSKQFQKRIDKGLAGTEAPGSTARLREIAAKARAAAK